MQQEQVDLQSKIDQCKRKLLETSHRVLRVTLYIICLDSSSLVERS